MNKQFYILIGRSGCGKGTQAELLKEKLSTDGLENVLHITTGGNFREFIQKDNYVATMSRFINDNGMLQPEFLAIWNWANLFIENLDENDSVILDGAPRKIYEMPALHSAVHFLGFERPKVIYIDVTESWAKERLLSRDREDDLEEEIDRKMYWFETDVLSVIDGYKNDPRYDFVHVNGEQTIDDVHNELVEKLNLVVK